MKYCVKDKLGKIITDFDTLQEAIDYCKLRVTEWENERWFEIVLDGKVIEVVVTRARATLRNNQANAIWEKGYAAGRAGHFDAMSRTLVGKFYTIYLLGVAAGEKSAKIVSL